MSGEPFSLADAEAVFGPVNWEHIGHQVDAAPEFSPEQCEKFRALFASARRARTANTAADAA
ncbi:hypothetical protein [Streptomyces sp. NPDC002132]|uniref:hypothetical protein n=1 Tax=unclassified Streptomyces TaxID=2593676 RepID=UPI00332798A6